MKSLERIFESDPDSTNRIINTLYYHPLSLKDCADILEIIAPLCTLYTKEGFLHHLMGSRPFYFDFH